MFYFLSLLMISSVFAGNSVGNGGDVVLCKGSVEILDFFEAKELYKKKLITSDKSHADIITERLKFLAVLAPALKNLYQKKLENYKVIVKNDIQLKNLRDEKHVFIPKFCQLKQIAHKINQPSSKIDILVNEEFWKKLDPVNKAGLLMHEVVYDHFRFFGAKDSSGVRKFVGKIFSDDFEEMSKSDLKTFFLEQNIPLD